MIDDTRIYLKNNSNSKIVEKFIDYYGHDALKCTEISNAWIIKDTDLSDKITIVEQVKEFSKKTNELTECFYIDFLNNGNKEKTIYVQNGNEEKYSNENEEIGDFKEKNIQFHESSSSNNHKKKKNELNGKTGLFGRGKRRNRY